MRIVWLCAALVLCAALAALHLWALDGYRYWRLPWLDVPIHFLGGLASGAFLIGFFARPMPLIYVMAVVLVLAGWEVFEYVFGMPRESNYLFDTALDVLMGALGGIAAYLAARFSIWR